MSSEPGPITLAPRLDALEAAVRARSALVPRLALVLGSGLGGLADAIEDPVAIPFAELPGWPAASAPGPQRPAAAGPPRGRARRLSPGPPAHVRGAVRAPGRGARAADGPAGRRHAAAHERRGRRQPRVPGGHPDAALRPPQPDRPDAAPRAQRRRGRAALPRPVGASTTRSCGCGCGRRRRRPASRSTRASTPGCWARPTRRPPRSACCGCWARTRWACPRSWRRSRRAGRGCAWRPISLVTNPGAGISADAALPRGGARGGERGRPAPGAGHPGVRARPARLIGGRRRCGCSRARRGPFGPLTGRAAAATMRRDDDPQPEAPLR